MMDFHRTRVTDGAFRDMVDEPRVAHNWQQIATKRKQKQISAGRRRMALLAAFALIGVGISASIHFVLESPSHPAPLTFEVSESVQRFDVPAESHVNRRIPLSDGSTITLAPGASLEVMENAQRRFVTSLYHGWARYNVIPDGGRTWEVNAALCRVVVLGTQFTVSRTPRAVRVAVHRGTVAVYPPTGSRVLKILRAGETCALRSPVKSEPEPVSSPPRIAGNAAQRPPEDHSFDEGRSAKKPSPPVRAGVGHRATSSSVAGLGASADVNRLLKEAKEARDRKQPERAVTLLEQALREYPHDPSVGLVTLTLATIHLDSLHQPRAAALLFKKAATSRGLPPSLREQAYGRSVEAFERAGDSVSARKMGNLYRRHYPDGAWLSWIERWTEFD